MKKPLTLKLLPFLLLVFALVMISSCKRDRNVKPDPIPAIGKYQNGFFIINEGYFQEINSSVSFFDYTSGKLTDSVYTKENPGKDFDPTSASLDFGTIYNGKIYLVSQRFGPLVVADALTLKETGRIPASPNNNWRAFAGIDETNGLVSTIDGVYPINLKTLAIGTKLASFTGEVGDMIKAGNYIFVLSKKDGLVILKTSDYSVVKSIPGLAVGFAKSKDGFIWAAGGTSLVRIDPANLDIKNIPLPFEVFGSWGFWHPGSIVGSLTDNSIFLARNTTFGGAYWIYKYTPSDASSLKDPFIIIPDNKRLHGCGMGFDPNSKQLVFTTLKMQFGDDAGVNDLYFYDPVSGAQKRDIAYNGFYFPIALVFH